MMDTNETDPKQMDDTTEGDQGVFKASRPRVLFGLDEAEADAREETNRKVQMQPTFSLDPEFLQRAPSPLTIRKMVSTPPDKYNTCPEHATSDEIFGDTCADPTYTKTKKKKIMTGKQSGNDDAEHSEEEFFDTVDSKVDFDDLKPINNSDQTTKSEPPILTPKFQTQPSLSKCVVENESLCIECVKPLQVVSKNDVRRGDHIGFAGKIYDHHAIVTEVYELKGSSPDIICLQMVHATNTSAKATFASLHPFGNKARLRKVEEIINFRQKRVVIYKYNSKINPFTPDEIVRRAISESDIDSKRGEGQFKYNLFKNNCEHFATWCVTGSKLSLQERKFTMVMWMFLSSGFRGISDEYQRHEKEYEYGMLCGACYQRNKKVLIVESRKILEASDIKKGDVITYSYWNLWHDAVVLRVEKSSSSDFVKCQIAHYAFQYFDHRRIIKEDLCIPLDGTVTKKIYPDNMSVFPADEVVKRAKQRLDEQEFAFFSNDSCQFCRWCKLKLKPD